MDIIIASILLLLFGPLMLLIGIGIKLHSPGPILYKQKRIGKDGRPFRMYKFRSMRDGSSEELHKNHVQGLMRNNSHPSDIGQGSLKLSNDFRITWLGRWLRRLSLDELPQLFNVLVGDMSMVGPRPPLPYEYELYEERHKERLSILPGITGYWQVTARNQASFEEMVQLDLKYIQEKSLWLDLCIMTKTPVEMIRGKGGG
jgi:lipopolysaccharide/colanic/teichoic acid biosynthesis glycosyltransferase